MSATSSQSPRRSTRLASYGCACAPSLGHGPSSGHQGQSGRPHTVHRRYWGPQLHVPGVGLLADLGVLVDTAIGAPYRLKGVMRRGDVRIINPPAWGVAHEGSLVVGDIRVNLLGLQGLKELGAKLSFD